MNDIPLTAEQLFVCEEKDLGVKLHLRYLTDAQYQNDFAKICQEDSEHIESHIEEAKKTLGDNAANNAIRIEAYRLYLESDYYKNKNQFIRFEKYIDTFLVGITGELKNVFPNGVCLDKSKMSKSILYFAKRKVYEAISANVDILTGLRPEEIKN